MSEKQRGKSLVVLGAGGHAKVVIEVAEANGYHVQLYDDAPLESLMGHPILAQCSERVRELPAVVAVGCNKTRSKIVDADRGLYADALVHPRAYCSDSVSVGKGTVLFAMAVVQAATRIGQHCIVNTAASIDHDCIVDDYVHIAPGVRLCGGVHIGAGTLVGVGAVVLPGVQIGARVVIGAGAVVTKTVTDGSVVLGNPGRVMTDGAGI